MTGPVKSLLSDFAWDVVLPVAVYYLARTAGIPEFGALVAAATAAAVRLIVLGITHRRFDGLAALMVALFTSALVLSLITGDARVLLLITGDARVLLLKDSVPEALSGIAFLVSVALRRPLLLALARRLGLVPRPDAMRAASALSLLWGACLLGFAALRVPVILALDPDVAVIVINVAFVVLAALLIAGTFALARPHLKRADA